MYSTRTATAPGSAKPVKPGLRLPRRIDVLTVAVVLLCYAIVGALPFSTKQFGDLDFYHEAKDIALAAKGLKPWTSVTIIRAPGPVIYYGLPYLFVPASATDNVYWNVAFVWTVFWMLIAVFLIRGAATRLYGETAGIITVALTLATPFWAYYSYGINGEGPAFLGAGMFLYGWARWRSSSQFRAIEAFLIAGGLAIFLLTKPSALGLAGIAAVAAIFWWVRKDRKQAVFAAACAILMLSLSMLSSRVLKNFEPESYRPAQLLYFRWTAYMGCYQMRTEPWDWRFWGNGSRPGSVDYANFTRDLAHIREEANRTLYSVFDLEWNYVVNDFIQHPGLRLKMALVRTLAMHVNLVNSVDARRFHLGPLKGRTGYILCHIAINAVYFVLIGASLVFLWTRRRQLPEYWLFWGPWVALVVFHALVYAEPRYLFPAQPGLLLMASAVLAPWFRRRFRTTS